MKRYSNLFPKIVDKNNIKTAIYKASLGKRNRKAVKYILDNIDEKVDELYSLLINNQFIPAPYKVKILKDGSCRKEREISCPKFFPDQCVHWAIMLQIEPIFKKRLYYYSCASVKGGGVHKAIRYVKRITRNDKRGTKWVLQMDVKKFYPSIDHTILKSKFRRVFKDNDLLKLLDLIVDSTEKGVPIGNYTSQWFANFFLADLDNYIKNLGFKYYVRYMDDMIVFCSNKKKLHELRKQINDFLTNEKLTLKQNWQIYSINNRGIDFLGVVVYRNRVILRDNIYLRMTRRARKIYKKHYVTLKDASAMISYWGWIKITNTNQMYHKQIKPYISIEKCKEIISHENKIRNKANAKV